MKMAARRFVVGTALVLSLGVSAGCAQSVASPAQGGSPKGSQPPASSTPRPDQAQSPTAPASDAAPSTSTKPTASSKPTASTKPSATPSPTAGAPVLKPGDSGDKVRELNHRLSQLDWVSGAISPSYSAATSEGVKGFQAKRGLPTTGIVDQTTWNKLVAMTKTPTRDQLYNIVKAGPALYKSGSTGAKVKEIQARLKQLDWFSPKVDGSYGASTVAGVKGFQGKRGFPVTGGVDRRTLDSLVSMTSTPTTEELTNKPPKAPAAGALDPRCMTGRVLCIDKNTDTLTWVVNGQKKLTLDVRFGSEQTPTREGVFSVFWKSRNHVSTIYHTPMPYAMFFSGGQAVHYSADFAARGYNGASHGCVNVRDKQGIIWLFDQVNTNDKVIVYRS